MADELHNTELGVVLEQADGESDRDYLDRIATETLYAASGRGLGVAAMGAAVVDVILKILA